MPFDSTYRHGIDDHSQESSGIDYERIRRWIQQLEMFRASLTPSVYGSQLPSTTTPTQWIGNETQSQTTLRRAGRHSDIISRGLTLPNPRPGNRGLISERSYPPAPLMLTIPLPQVTEEVDASSFMSTTASPAPSLRAHSIGQPAITTSDHPSGRSAHQPHHRLVAVQSDIPATASRPEQPQQNLAVELRYHEFIRPVVKAVLSDMPSYNGHCWGAREDDRRDIRGLNIHFPQSTAPATNPPVTRMKLARPFGGRLVVTPAIGNQFVTICDVQRTVIAWMRWEQPHVQHDGLQLTGRMAARARNGTTREVDVWVWRGLTRGSGETEEWEINL